MGGEDVVGLGVLLAAEEGGQHRHLLGVDLGGGLWGQQLQARKEVAQVAQGLSLGDEG